MKIFCVRIGNKYDQRYEDYIERKLKGYDITWIREPFDKSVQMQWNKMLPMSLNLEEPVCVIDIDILLTHDYHQLFEYPIKRGQFLAAPNWWNETHIDLNGGFFKYYPKDCNYIFDAFMKNPLYWQRKYIEAGLTSGPINGEQFFVRDLAEQELEVIRLPAAWFTRWTTMRVHEMSVKYEPDETALIYEKNLTDLYKKITGNEYLCRPMGNGLVDFHPDIKFVHFTHTINKPHEWEYYDNFVN